MKDPIRTWNRHVQDVAALHEWRTRLKEDGVRVIRLGTKKHEGEAFIFGYRADDWRWGLFTPKRDVRPPNEVRDLGLWDYYDDGTAYYVDEKHLVTVLEAIRPFRPMKKRYRPDLAGRVPAGFQKNLP